MDSIGTFAGFNIATSALNAASLGEDVTGNNIANSSTPGYAEETLVLTNSVPVVSADLTTDAAELGYVGTGVSASGVTNATDNFLSNQVYNANSEVGNQTAQQQWLSSVQDAFNEPGSNTINTQLSQFFANFTAVQSTPSDSGAQLTAIQGGVTLAQDMNQAASQLQTTASSLSTSITNDQTQINSLGTQIAQLNANIVEGTTSQGQPNSLLDERNSLLSQLSNVTNIAVSYNADNSINIKIGGTVLVSGVTSNTVSASAMQARGDLTGGDLGGLEASQATLTTAQTGLNNLAAQVVSQVNTLHEAGYGQNGTTGIPFFTGTDASSIAVNSTLIGNPQDLAVASSLPSGSTTPAPGDGSNAQAIANLGTATLGSSAGALSGQTFSNYYNAFITTVANNASSATTELGTATATQTQLTNQSNSITGVNTDTELTNMMEWQKMYQAASELISTENTMINQMISTLFTQN